MSFKLKSLFPSSSMHVLAAMEVLMTSVLYHFQACMERCSVVRSCVLDGNLNLTKPCKFSIKLVKVKANVDKSQTGYKGTSGNCQISSFNKGNSETDNLEENKF